MCHSIANRILAAPQTPFERWIRKESLKDSVFGRLFQELRNESYLRFGSKISMRRLEETSKYEKFQDFRKLLN